MLGDARFHATLPAQDLERARTFYSERLGLEPAEESEAGLWYEGAGGSRFFLFQTSGAPSGSHTQLGFNVSDIEAVVAELQSRGVEFKEYDYPTLKTVGGIATTTAGRAAWFEDSEGNLLGIVQLSA
jgi:predicted enzyme related to lactoylglutathione lyase